MHNLKKYQAIRGQVLTYKDDPFHRALEQCLVYESDGIIVFENGLIKDFDSATIIKQKYPEQLNITQYNKQHLITSGFIDCHVHYPQVPIIGAYGEQLIDWLNKYTFKIEQKFNDFAYASSVAKFFLQECLRNGTTTAMVYCTVHPESVEAFFTESEKLNMRNIAGKVLMDRNAPGLLTDTATSGYEQSKILIEKWHNKNRQLYSITPRFAPTSSPEQLEMIGALWHESPGTYLQSHLSENLAEIEWVKQLFPKSKNYTDVYNHYRLLGPRSVYGHGVHLSSAELELLDNTGTALAHCPTSNLFLGSGLFNLKQTMQMQMRIGLGTDLGAGTSFSQLQTLGAAYKVAQLQNYALNSHNALYMATRGTARALYLEDKIGSIASGMEADVIVLDLHSTPLMEYRMKTADSLEEKLFVLITLGDDRAIKATYIAGEIAYGK